MAKDDYFIPPLLTIFRIKNLKSLSPPPFPLITNFIGKHIETDLFHHQKKSENVYYDFGDCFPLRGEYTCSLSVY